MKCYFSVRVQQKSKSLPVRGAWVEMLFGGCCHRPPAESLPVRGAWVEISGFSGGWWPLASLPVRGAWVEIERCAMVLRYSAVAPRAGSVG